MGFCSALALPPTDGVMEWWWGLEPIAKKERVVETSSVQKGDFIKAQDWTRGQEELHWDCEG